MSVIDRRRLLAGLSASLLGVVRPAAATPAPVALGAIRWDPWYETGPSAERHVLEGVLSQPRWRARAPDCALLDETRVSLTPCATAAQIDREVALAEALGLEYWAFCWYGEGRDLQDAWRFYRQSRRRKRLAWCPIVGAKEFSTERGTSVARFVALMKESDFMRAEGGRPLFYVLQNGAAPSAVRETAQRLRAAAAAEGIREPYIVLLMVTLERVTEAYGVDALGIYGTPGWAPFGAPYADLVHSVEDYWRRLSESGQAIVPTVVTGFDRRPRVETRVPWEAAMPAELNQMQRYWRAGTPIEIAEHIDNMVRWIQLHPEACPARVGLIYSWNEFDEGGTTLAPSHGGGSALVDALAGRL